MAVTNEGEPPAAWSNLAPIDVQHLLEMGVPAHLIDEGRLDADGLRLLGWEVSDHMIAPPEDNTLTDEQVERRWRDRPDDVWRPSEHRPD